MVQLPSTPGLRLGGFSWGVTLRGESLGPDAEPLVLTQDLLNEQASKHPLDNAAHFLGKEVGPERQMS